MLDAKPKEPESLANDHSRSPVPSANVTARKADTHRGRKEPESVSPSEKREAERKASQERRSEAAAAERREVALLAAERKRKADVMKRQLDSGSQEAQDRGESMSRSAGRPKDAKEAVRKARSGRGEGKMVAKGNERQGIQGVGKGGEKGAQEAVANATPRQQSDSSGSSGANRGECGGRDHRQPLHRQISLNL